MRQWKVVFDLCYCCEERIGSQTQNMKTALEFT